MHRILFQIFEFPIYSYGLSVALAFLICTFLVYRESLSSDMSFDKIMDCLLWVIIGGIVGGRLLFVLINADEYLRYPLKIILIRDGGLAFHGSLIVGAVSGLVACRIKELDFMKAADLVAPYIALGQAIGRVGCYLNGCCYGSVTTRGWGCHISRGSSCKDPGSIVFFDLSRSDIYSYPIAEKTKKIRWICFCILSGYLFYIQVFNRVFKRG